jgi:hypothetical protein
MGGVYKRSMKGRVMLRGAVKTSCFGVVFLVSYFMIYGWMLQKETIGMTFRRMDNHELSSGISTFNTSIFLQSSGASKP